MIYYFDGNIIGRSSGRSSVGAAAYRAGEKLRSHAAGSAAYRAGDELREDNGIIHDYTRKGGVKHSEIMLPKDAPPKYKDRETLWNAVEKREKRKDAQLAREFVVGLQREFELQEQIEVLREYIKENFVDKGMCADFSIHNKDDTNPHAHIMLTTRTVTPNGFGLKNTDWNDKALFLEWRKNWADVNNRMFECKGLTERIDHRSYKEQGIDREPMIHLGHEAAALERKGIKTERGDHNREVMRRNEERVKLKETEQLKAETTEQHTEELRKVREAQKTAPHIEKPIENQSDPPYVSTLENQLKAEKAMQHLEKMQEQQSSAEQTAERMNELKEKYIELEAAKILLMAQHNKDKGELPPLAYRAELIEEHAKNIEILQSRVEQLREARQNVRLLEFAKKKVLDEKLSLATQELGRAQNFFKNRFHINPSQAYEEMKRLQDEIRIKQEELNAKQIIVQDIRKKQDSIELAYHTQKLLNETRPDHEQINSLLEQMRQPRQSVRGNLNSPAEGAASEVRNENSESAPTTAARQLQERIEHQLNTVSDTSFQKVIDTLPPYEARILTNIREQAKERQRQIEQTKERERTIERSR